MVSVAVSGGRRGRNRHWNSEFIPSDWCSRLTRQFERLLGRRDPFPVVSGLVPLGMTIGETKEIWCAEFSITGAAGLGDFEKL